MDNLQLKNKNKEKIKLSFLIFIAIFIYSLTLLFGYTLISSNDKENDLNEQNKQFQIISNNNIDSNMSKKIDIKSLNENSTNVIELFNIENYFTGFLHFDQGENPTIYSSGDSIVIVGFSLNVKANIEFAFDKYYISSIDYVFKSKFSRSIPIDQLMEYEYDYGREAITSGSFIYSSNPTSINDLVLLENLNLFIFETNTFLQTGSMFDDNGIIFNNKISYKTINNKWHTNEFNTPTIDGFYDTNKFFSNGNFLKSVHKPGIAFYFSGINDLITSNNNKDYEVGYDKGYLDGKNDTIEEFPPLDKVNVTFKYIWSTITNAVNSVLNVFDREILPGIPLYAFLMIPVIISILFFVLKVVKK